MHKHTLNLKAFFVLFFLISGLIPLQINQLLPFACGAERLNFGLHAEEIPQEEPWKTEFTEISSKTLVAMSLPTEELQTLIQRCETLQPAIEALEETPRKIYLKRLEKTQSLFEFVLESRQGKSE